MTNAAAAVYLEESMLGIKNQDPQQETQQNLEKCIPITEKRNRRLIGFKRGILHFCLRKRDGHVTGVQSARGLLCSGKKLYRDCGAEIPSPLMQKYGMKTPGI